jgi:hypothetical protein
MGGIDVLLVHDNDWYQSLVLSRTAYTVLVQTCHERTDRLSPAGPGLLFALLLGTFWNGTSRSGFPWLCSMEGFTPCVALRNTGDACGPCVTHSCPSRSQSWIYLQ